MTPDPNPRPRRLVPLGLLLTVVIALAVRALYWSEVRDATLYVQPTGDAATYVAQAETMRRDGFLAPLGQPYRQAPLYPAFLWLGGSLGLDLGTVRWIQYLLGAATAALMWRLGRRLAGPVAGAVSGIAAAVYGPLVFFEGELLSISLAVFFLALGMALWEARRGAFGAGLAFGIAVLGQPNLLLAGLLPLAAALARPTAHRLPDRRAALLLLAGFLLPAATTGVRNLWVSGEPVLVSVNGGVNFFIGNNPEADGSFTLPPGSGLLNRPEGLFTSAREVAEQATGRPLTDAAADRWWGLRGLDFWLADPARGAGLFLRKTFLSINNYEVPNHYDYDYFKRHAPLLRVLPTLAWLLPLGLPGLVLLVRRGRRTEALWAAGVVISVALFFVTGRYRLPLVVFLLPAAGVSAAYLWERRRRPVALAPWAAGALAGLVLAVVPILRPGSSQAHMLNVEGASLYASGDVAGAAEAFRRAVELDPTHAEAINNLGRMLALAGKPTEAVEQYRRALVLAPTQAETYFNLEEIYRNAGRLAEAAEILDRLVAARSNRVDDVAGALAYRRGLGALAAGDSATARRHLADAVTRDPDTAGAWATLAALAVAAGDVEQATAASERAVAISPRLREAQMTRGAALALAGRLEDAVAAYDLAWKLSPSLPEAPYRIGLLYRRLGDIPKAEGHLRACVERSPYPPALLELGSIYEELGRPRDALIVYRVLAAQEAASPERGRARDRLRALGVREGDAPRR